MAPSRSQRQEKNGQSQLLRTPQNSAAFLKQHGCIFPLSHAASACSRLCYNRQKWGKPSKKSAGDAVLMGSSQACSESASLDGCRWDRLEMAACTPPGGGEAAVPPKQESQPSTEAIHKERENIEKHRDGLDSLQGGRKELLTGHKSLGGACCNSGSHCVTVLQ